MLTEGYDQGPLEIEADFGLEVANGAQSGVLRVPSDDDLEDWFVDHEYTVKRLAMKFNLSQDEVRDRLLALGLEVDSKVRDGLQLQADALPPTQHQQYGSVEDCITVYLQEKRGKKQSRKGPVRV